MDRRFLKVIIEHYNGGPVGVNTIAAALQEEVGTVEEIIEPYLMQLGLLARTSQGRVVTDKAYQYLNLPLPENNKLF